MSNSRIRQLTPLRALRDFFEYIYGDVDGFVRAPTKNPANDDWEENWFRWPSEKSQMLQHFSQQTSLELYFSPSLFRTNSVSKANWLGTSVLWTELDYGIPTPQRLEESGVPAPSLRIQSSTEDHQHWYWKLEYFETNPEVLEELNKRITYATDADRSAWDYQQVLRPPTTLHQESGRPVTVLERSDATYGSAPFMLLPEPPQDPQGAVREDVRDLPEVLEVIAKYKWNPVAFETFRKRQVEKGKRTDTLCYLAYECAEMGMADVEILSVLISADDRWGHFRKRNDRVKRLLGIIARARQKYPVVSATEVEDEWPVFDFKSFVELEFTQQWIVPGLWAEATIDLVAAGPKVGKSQTMLRGGMKLALAQPFLKWEVPEPKRSLFFSMEMGRGALKSFMDIMREGLSEEELQQLKKYMHVVPLGYGVQITKLDVQTKLQRMVDKYKPDVLFIDSLGVAVGDNVNANEVINPAMDALKRTVIEPFGTSVVFIHHTNRDAAKNDGPMTMYDMYGSQYIAGHITSGIGLRKRPMGGKDTLEVSCLASRLTKEWEPFYVERTETLDFRVMALDEVVAARSAPVPTGRPTSDNDRPSPSFPGIPI